MHSLPLLPACIRLISDFSGKVVLSLAASAVAAAILAAISDHSPAQPPAPVTVAWTSPVAADGKIRERHHDAVSNDAAVDRSAVSGLVTPAAFAMPMNAAWPDGVFQLSRQNAGSTALVVLPQIASASVATLPAATRKAAVLPERQKLAQSAVPAEKPRVVGPPAQIEPASSRSAETAEPSVLGRVGGAMADAVGTVGAAGIWTLSQASSLLPRL